MSGAMTNGRDGDVHPSNPGTLNGAPIPRDSKQISTQQMLQKW